MADRGSWPWIVTVVRGHRHGRIVAVAALWLTMGRGHVVVVMLVLVPTRFQFHVLEPRTGSGLSGSVFIASSAGSSSKRVWFPVPRFLGFLHSGEWCSNTTRITCQVFGHYGYYRSVVDFPTASLSLDGSTVVVLLD